MTATTQRKVEFPPPAGASTAPASIRVRRRIQAPAPALFDAWLDPEAIDAWMRPFDTVRTEATANAVVGGAYRIDMHQPDGGVVEHVGKYVEIDRPRRLVRHRHPSYLIRPARLRAGSRIHEAFPPVKRTARPRRAAPCRRRTAKANPVRRR